FHRDLMLKSMFEQQEHQHNQKLAEMETFYKDRLNEERSARKEKEEEFISFKERTAKQLPISRDKVLEVETLYKKKLDEVGFALRQKEKELKSTQMRLNETEKFYEQLKKQRQTADLKSSCHRCELIEHEDKQRMSEMENFYKEKLQMTRSSLKQKEEEVISFKKRLAADMTVSLKTSNTESMNNPVSKTRLTEMYDNLKLLQWPKIKDQLKSKNINPEVTKDLIQKTFGAAFEEMQTKKQQIEEAFGLTESSRGMTSQKVKEYRQLTVQNLQMVLFHSSKEDLLKTGFPEHGEQYLEDMVDLRPLTSESYWLGCLMALNKPPLQPDWKNHVPSMDPWDIFPRDIKSFAAV
ncbi:hypothetical protein XENOCAPTIV_027742, partial [Xenoophorus captivus]